MGKVINWHKQISDFMFVKYVIHIEVVTAMNPLCMKKPCIEVYKTKI